LGQMWRIGKRRFGRDWRRRIRLFDKLVWMSYGVEMGMEGKGRDGKIAREVFEVDFRVEGKTPEYLIREEV